MKNYFSIPNLIAFLNVSQVGRRVIKGSAIMGFSHDPKECLDDVAGDLRTMGCSLFYEKCQEVVMVSKLILLGVTNSIQEEVIKGTLNIQLAELERTIFHKDSKNKLTKSQQANWIKYAVVKEFLVVMPWEEAEEKKQKQGNNNARLAYVIQVYHPDYERIKTLCQIVKQCKLWHRHWGNAVFTVKLLDNESQQGKKTRYIQMVHIHSLVQLSLGAASINRLIEAELKFSLRRTPNSDGKPRAPTHTLVRDVFSMMEISGRKVWICLARGSNGMFTGYFSSMVEAIKDHISNFVTCPGAQVY
jgi:hypothetical protein